MPSREFSGFVETDRGRGQRDQQLGGLQREVRAVILQGLETGPDRLHLSRAN